MTKHPVALAIALALSVSVVLPGCDNTASLTEQEHIQRAKDFEDKGNLKSSIIELKNAIQKNPDSPQARLLLGQIYLKAGKGAEAEKELSQAEKLGVNRETIKPQLGEALLLMGEYKRVLDEIVPGERTSKTNIARIYQIRADAMLNQGNLKDACALYQQSLDTDATNPSTYWGLARCSIAGHDTVKARTWLDAALKLDSRQADTWVLIGDVEQLNKNTTGALAAYTDALKADPNNLEALRNRAALNMALGQLDAAQLDVEKVDKLARKSLTAHYLHALLDFERRQYPEAREALSEVVKIAPDYMPGVLLAGATDYSLGSYQQAESNLVRFLVRFPGHAYARRVLAATQIQLKQPDKALATLAPVLSADPQDAPALALAGEASLQKHELTQATEYFTKSMAIDPKNAQTQTQLGLSLLASGDGQLAIAELGKAATLGDDQGSPDILLVMVLLDRKEYDQALAATDAMEKKLQKSAVSRTMRGSAYLGKNDLAKARESFEQALAINPTFIPAATSLAQLDIHDNKPGNAQKRFESILDKDKNNLQAMMALAELAASNKQEKEYVDWLDKAAKLNPKAIPPRVVLARHYLTLNEPQKAMAIASELVNTNPESLDALDLLGTVQLALNDKAGAVSTFNKMAQKANQSPDVLQRLAIAQIANNQLADARVTLQKALKISPNHQPNLDALIRLDMREGKHEDALQIARRAEAASPQSPFGFEREGDILLNQKQPAQAAKAYEQAFAKGAGSTGLIKLHRAMTLSGNAATADLQLKSWIKQHPDDLAVLAYAAENAMAAGKNKEAIAYYEAILKQAPQNATVLNNLAGLYQREADSRALPTAEQALKIEPGSPAIQDTLGWILVEQGQAKRGLELLDKALAQIPKNPSILYHYAVALARTGDQAGARKRFERLIKEFPGSPEAVSAKSQLQSR
jgi:putative PEP-CTERM system TPR-repeat lipoprotein